MIPAPVLKTCLGAILLSIGLYWLYSFILGKTLGAETAFAVAFIPTVLMLLSITNLSGIWTNLVDSSALKRSDGLPGFQEGKRVAACGRIYPVNNQPVKSPFTRKDCVAYSYKVEYRGGEFNDTDYAGRRLIPSAVKTPNGDVRLLSWPGFRGFDSSVVDDVTPVENVYQNAAEYICSTPFQVHDSSGGDKRNRVKAVFRVVKDFLTDDDGDIRWETASRDVCERAKITKESGGDTATFDAADSASIANRLRGRSLEEVCVEAGEEVCLIGIWSPLKRGIVTDSAKGIMPVLIRGNRREIEHFLRSQTTKRLMWGVGLAGIANLGIWLAVELTM